MKDKRLVDVMIIPPLAKAITIPTVIKI